MKKVKESFHLYSKKDGYKNNSAEDRYENSRNAVYRMEWNSA